MISMHKFIRQHFIQVVGFLFTKAESFKVFPSNQGGICGGVPGNFPVTGFGHPPTGLTEYIPARDAYFNCHWHKVHYFGASECILQSLILQNFSGGGWGCAQTPLKLAYYYM